LNAKSDLDFSRRNATHHTYVVVSYMKEKLKSFHACFRGDITTTFYNYKAKKGKQCLNPSSDLDFSCKNLIRDTPYIYGYFICERMIIILSWIRMLQSGHNHHLLYCYNKKTTKFEPPQWPWPNSKKPQVLFATHHNYIYGYFICEQN
jgi:hypothetical protein